MRVDNSIYNLLSVNLAPKKRNVTHKSSELKAVYNDMVKYNKNSPLYILSLSEDKQTRIIDIKEAAITLRDVADSFSDSENDIYKTRNLVSENPDYITGSFRNKKYDSLPEQLSISVEKLAEEQVNTGHYLESKELDIEPGSYSFYIKTAKTQARFTASVEKDDTNYDIQKRLAQSINSRRLGINASIIDEGANSSLMLSSADTGVPNTDDGLHFSIYADSDSSFIEALGLGNISRRPANSTFTINGEAHSSTSNHISINQIIELDFLKPTPSPIAINFIPDTTLISEQLRMFSEAYNSLVDNAQSSVSNIGSRNLMNDISGIVKKHATELNEIGLTADDSGHLSISTADIEKTITKDKLTNLFGDLSGLKNEVTSTANKLSLDPMAYINKLIVTYPNTSNKFGSAYTQSLYSGLMYNNYA